MAVRNYPKHREAMAKGLLHSHPEQTLTWRQLLSYGGGSVASNLSWNMVAGFLIVYYTDTALLSAAAVGTLVLFTRVFDALIDPVVGMLVDRTRSRFGKARPYLLYAALPFAGLCVLTFSVPSTSSDAKLIYAYVTYGLLGVSYSFLYVPYGALQPLITSDRAQLLRLSGVRAVGTSIASIIVYALVLPIVALFGGGDRGRGYTYAAAIFAIATTILFWVTFANCHERLSTRKSAVRQQFFRDLRSLLGNEVWIIAMIFGTLIFISLGVLVPSMAYLAKEVLGQPSLTSVLLPTMSVAILLGGLLAPRYLTHIGKSRGTKLALAFAAVCFGLLPLSRDSVELFLFVFFLSTVSNGVLATMVFTLISEAVALQEQREGVQLEGIVASTASLAQKVGFALGSALVAYVLAIAGYDPAVPQPRVANALLWLVSGVPIVVCLLQIVCIAFYKPDRVFLATSSATAVSRETSA